MIPQLPCSLKITKRYLQFAFSVKCYPPFQAYLERSLCSVPCSKLVAGRRNPNARNFLSVENKLPTKINMTTGRSNEPLVWIDCEVIQR